MPHDKIFFFDGNCPFCTHLANWLKKKSLDPDIEFHSFHTIPEVDRLKIHDHLSDHVCSGNVQYILNGKRLPGFFGIRRLFFSIQTVRYFTPLLYLPGIPILGIFILFVLKKYIHSKVI